MPATARSSGKRSTYYGLQPHPDETLRIVGVMPTGFDYLQTRFVENARVYTW